MSGWFGFGARRKHRSKVESGVVLLALGAVLGCSGSDASGVTEEGVDEAARAAGRREFESIRERFGPLQTLAGTGTHGDDSNDWLPVFEGGAAIAAELSTPHNALADLEGNVYIADKDAHAIRRVAPDGTIHTVAGLGSSGDDGDAPGTATEVHLSQPNGIWVSLDGTVYILDLANRKVRRLSRDGVLSTLFAAPSLTTGRGLWVSADETLAYVCSGRELLRWTAAEGVHVFADGFRDLGNLYVDEAAGVVVTDRGDHRVYRVFGEADRELLAGDGTARRPTDGAAALTTGLNGVRGVWRHPDGGWLLATHEGSQVVYVDTRGYLHVLIDGARGAHSGDGQALSVAGAKVSEVRNVTMSPAGDLLVTEHDFGFIRIARAAADR